MKFPALLLALLLTCGAVQAQHQHHTTQKGDEAALVTGMGTWHHPVTTRNAEAQRFFDQGLRFVYAFNHDEAVRSFRRAAALDPSLAMAHWGLAGTLEAQRKMREAALARRQFAAAWKNADIKLKLEDL